MQSLLKPALAPYGLDNVDTPHAGITLNVPLRVEFDGIVTKRTQLRCKHVHLGPALANDGLVNVTTAKPGEQLQLPVRIMLDATLCQPVFELNYKAKYDKLGKAKGGI
ncbi:MAG: hypothetical protein DRQ55_13980 [Planctomycetota bacterium]|nr:MAG: hypothetical protein DRQ55_13980 [Planctomycetota bacterium]